MDAPANLAAEPVAITTADPLTYQSAVITLGRLQVHAMLSGPDSAVRTVVSALRGLNQIRQALKSAHTALKVERNAIEQAHWNESKGTVDAAAEEPLADYDALLRQLAIASALAEGRL